jgi:hypothetical protein
MRLPAPCSVKVMKLESYGLSAELAYHAPF